MKNNKFALHIIVFGLIALSFIACDKDFTTLQSDIINSENATNFEFLSEQHDIITYTQALEPVQTNGLGLNTLGVYDDLYGRTISSFVTQVTTATFDPVFGDEAAIDSVVLKIPYFSIATEIDDDGNITYVLDSVIGTDPIKLSLFESNYFIRDFDPDGDFNDAQAYFSNKSASATENIPDAVLEGEELIMLTAPETSHLGNNIIEISEEGFVLTEPDNEDDEDTDPQILIRDSPGVRIRLDPAYWQNKILDKEGDPVLSSQTNFAEYFRGLYFKAEVESDNGSFLILNVGAQTSVVTIYYTRLTPSTSDDADETEQATFVLRFGPNRINFMDNNFTTPINNGDPVTGDSRLYLKGGEGSLANIKLFNGDDIDENPEMNAFEIFKNEFVETDDDGNFVRAKRLVNEANLVFYVDQEIVQDGEPDRIYLYDKENKLPLVDYYLDNNISSLPSFSIINHLGPLERVDDEPTGDGIRYKLRITDHINNLILDDSTNVELGLAVSLNVNLEESFAQRRVQSADNSELRIPISSIITPRGTVLHGNNTEDDSKKVYLEIYYTEPNN